MADLENENLVGGKLILTFGKPLRLFKKKK